MLAAESNDVEIVATLLDHINGRATETDMAIEVKTPLAVAEQLVGDPAGVNFANKVVLVSVAQNVREFRPATAFQADPCAK